MNCGQETRQVRVPEFAGQLDGKKIWTSASPRPCGTEILLFEYVCDDCKKAMESN